MATEDLKHEILDLKKRLHTITSENYLLKVKIRKLQCEVEKKNKQIECLLDPNKSSCVRKLMSERGASMIINLKQKNDELEQILITKENIIKKLQSNINISKIYSSKESLSCKKYNENKHISLKNECTNTCLQKQKKYRSRSLSITPIPKQSFVKSSSAIQTDYFRLAQNLEKIKLINNVSNESSSSLTEENIENEFPYVANSVCTEDQKVEKYFSNVIEEMKKIRSTVSHLSAEQQNTKQILQDKNKNIEKLSRKIKDLQKSKCNTLSPKPPVEQTVETYSYSEDNFENDSTTETINSNNSSCISIYAENKIDIQKR